MIADIIKETFAPKACFTQNRCFAQSRYFRECEIQNHRDSGFRFAQPRRQSGLSKTPGFSKPSKNDFIRFIIYAFALTDETIDHLETLHETGSLKDDNLFESLRDCLSILGKMINNFLSSVQTNHRSTK